MELDLVGISPQRGNDTVNFCPDQLQMDTTGTRNRKRRRGSTGQLLDANASSDGVSNCAMPANYHLALFSARSSQGKDQERQQ